MCGTTTKQGCLFSVSIAHCCKNKITFFWLFNCNYFSHPLIRTITSEGHFRDFFCTLAAKLIINIYWSEIKIKTYQKLLLAIHGIIIAVFSQGAESQQMLPEVHIKSNVNANIHVQLVAPKVIIINLQKLLRTRKKEKETQKKKLQMFTACPYANRQIITHTHPPILKANNLLFLLPCERYGWPHCESKYTDVLDMETSLTLAIHTLTHNQTKSKINIRTKTFQFLSCQISSLTLIIDRLNFVH